MIERSLQILLLGVALTVGLSGCGSSGDPNSLIAKAQSLREKGNHKAAIIELKNALQKDSNSAEARYWLGVTHYDNQEFRPAEQELRRALELSYERSKVMPVLGKAILQLGEFQRVLDQVPVESHTSNAVQADVLTLRARALMGLGRDAQARELLAAALAKQPEFSDALTEQGRIAALDLKLDESLRLIDRAIAAAPKNIDAWLIKSDVMRARGDQAGSLATSQKILEISPSNFFARLQMASLYLATNKLDDARKMIAQMRSLDPRNILPIHMQALVAYRTRDFKAANDEILQVLKVAPDHMPSVLLAGAILFELGSHEQAQTHLARIVQSSPTNSFAQRLLATTLARSGQLPRAIDVLQVGLKHAPEDSGLLTVAGELHMQSGEYAKASKFFEAAAKAEPKNAVARANLGVSRMAAGDTARAFADLQSSVEMDAGQYQTDMLLIATHLERGNFEQALKATQALEKKQPNNPLTYFIKATAFSKNKDVANARKNLERALQLQPTFWQATTGLVELDIQAQDGKAARKRLEALLESDKNSLPALLALAELGPHIGATQKERIDWLERAAKVNSRIIEPRLMMARLYAQGGDVKKGLEVAQQALSSSPGNVFATELVGELQQRAGQTNQAVVTFTELAKAHPKSPVALYRLAGAHTDAGNDAAAIAALSQAVALQPDYIAAHEAMVGLHLRARRYAEAMNTARRLQKDYAKSPVGYLLEGDIVLAERKFEQAIKAYDTAFQLVKTNGSLIKLHRAYDLAGKAADGDARTDQWLKENPGDVTVRLVVAASALKRANYKIAIGHYELLQKAAPADPRVLNDLAWAYYSAKDARALETAQQAMKVAPNSPIVMDTLGWILVEQGESKRGLELLEKAAKGMPKVPDIGYHYAQALLKAGNKSKAREEVERVLALNTNFSKHADAKELLKQLGK